MQGRLEHVMGQLLRLLIKVIIWPECKAPILEKAGKADSYRRIKDSYETYGHTGNPTTHCSTMPMLARG
jgi:hypothetical protein